MSESEKSTACEIAKDHNSCSFLYDPAVSVILPKYKIIMTYEDELVKILGCNVVIRSDLDKVALFFLRQNAVFEKRDEDKYALFVCEKSNSPSVWSCLVTLKFNPIKYLFEVT